MPLAGLLEEVAAAQALAEGLGGPQSVTDGSEDGTGLGPRVREPSISAAAQPAELGWEAVPSVLASDVDLEGAAMKEVPSLQVRRLGCSGLGWCGRWFCGFVGDVMFANDEAVHPRTVRQH
jgi:hypothetical protein